LKFYLCRHLLNNHHHLPYAVKKLVEPCFGAANLNLYLGFYFRLLQAGCKENLILPLCTVIMYWCLYLYGGDLLLRTLVIVIKKTGRRRLINCSTQLAMIVKGKSPYHSLLLSELLSKLYKPVDWCFMLLLEWPVFVYSW